jgi:hypothetical protein
MGSALLHSPWVHFYLVCFGAVWVAFLWDFLSSASPTRDGAGALPDEAAQGAASPPRPRLPEPGSVLKP